VASGVITLTDGTGVAYAAANDGAPGSNGSGDNGMPLRRAERKDYKPGQQVPVVIDGQPLPSITVDDIMP
jgi:hypothetical protein